MGALGSSYDDLSVRVVFEKPTKARPPRSPLATRKSEGYRVKLGTTDLPLTSVPTDSSSLHYPLPQGPSSRTPKKRLHELRRTVMTDKTGLTGLWSMKEGREGRSLGGPVGVSVVSGLTTLK